MINKSHQFFLSLLESIIFYFIMYIFSFTFVFGIIMKATSFDVAYNSLEVKRINNIGNDFLNLFNYNITVVLFGLFIILLCRILFNFIYYYVLKLDILGIPFINHRIVFVNKSLKFKYFLLKSLGIFSLFFVNYNNYFSLLIDEDNN